jgi:hypothetical protein
VQVQSLLAQRLPVLPPLLLLLKPLLLRRVLLSAHQSCRHAPGHAAAAPAA